jgi:hypothetical protein
MIALANYERALLIPSMWLNRGQEVVNFGTPCTGRKACNHPGIKAAALQVNYTNASTLCIRVIVTNAKDIAYSLSDSHLHPHAHIRPLYL